MAFQEFFSCGTRRVVPMSLSPFLCLTVECLALFTANALPFLGLCYWYHHTYLTDLILLWRLVGWITAPVTTNGEGNLNSGKYHTKELIATAVFSWSVNLRGASLGTKGDRRQSALSEWEFQRF